MNHLAVILLFYHDFASCGTLIAQILQKSPFLLPNEKEKPPSTANNKIEYQPTKNKMIQHFLLHGKGGFHMVCPSCGMKNNYYHRYCFHCGRQLTSEESLEKESSEKISFSSDADGLLLEEEADSSLTEGLENPDDQAFSSSLPDTDIFDDFLLDFSAKDKEESAFDIQSHMPLRRYRKAEKSEDVLLKVIKTLITIVLIALIGILAYVGYAELIKNRADNQPVAKVIDFDYRVEETELNGQPARKILVISSAGEQIKVRDEVIPVVSGQAEIILADREFDPSHYGQTDGALEVTLPLTVLADGYPSRTEEIRFKVPIQTVPVTFLSPSKMEILVEGRSYPLLLKVLPGSSVFVNGSNYSHLVDDEGQFSLQLEISDQPETRYEIRVSSKGYGELVEEIVFRKKQMEFALSINQKIPIQAGQDDWVEITGNTHPEASLSSSLETREDIQLDPATGDFRLFVKAASRGSTPFTLTARLEGKEDSVLEAVIQRQDNESEYTRSAWAMDYDSMRAYPDLHNGIPFTFSGNVTDVQSTGIRTTLLVNVSAQDQPEKLVHVEFWGTLQIGPGRGVRIFGNHWGNKDNIPYILASYIYLD
jgi:hypothetical protein